DFEIAAGDRAVLDLGAVEIGEHLAVADQLLRHAVNRKLEFVAWVARGLEFGFVIAGEEALRIVDRRNAHRLEILLEERARLRAVERAGGDGPLANLIERAVDRARLAHRRSAFENRLAAVEERAERRRLIVVGPAVERGERRRLHLGVAEFQRTARGGGSCRQETERRAG